MLCDSLQKKGAGFNIIRKMIPFDLIAEFLRFLTIPFVNLNFIDIAILVIIGIYAFEGYVLGFIRGISDFVSFILSFIFGLTFYGIFGDLLISNFQIPAGFANALGFFLGAFISEVILTLILRQLVLPFVIARSEEFSYPKEIERILGIIPGTLSAVVLLAFVLTMIVALPISPFLKNSVSASRLGYPLVSNISGLDKKLNNVFGGAVDDALTFLTVEPKSEELLRLNFQTANIKPDRQGEIEMLAQVNEERRKAGATELEEDQGLRDVARKHCSDMFQRGYFSHYTPEGKSPFDRMAQDNIDFTYAGENLALAPNASLAMQGLMNSPGHRANILSENFGKVGIGVIDSGIYGEMFCQEFTD